MLWYKWYYSSTNWDVWVELRKRQSVSQSGCLMMSYLPIFNLGLHKSLNWCKYFSVLRMNYQWIWVILPHTGADNTPPCLLLPILISLLFHVKHRHMLKIILNFSDVYYSDYQSFHTMQVMFHFIFYISFSFSKVMWTLFSVNIHDLHNASCLSIS